ncbi:hypothetical protein COX74_02665 [bacterium (Candidatus Gribaldobacteria) CG_4_10_14_0_2_um_filter_41_16]|uniref:Uncharacterized protein n=4 Tax=Candidatus Gribaldobacteria TaxID=2798536 RepID=A0A2M7VHY6_9BACT|nr:MAG: hypothetical protein AUJ36_03775 [Parcubacteria group bacterium CG1_02_41_26]PIR91402.1 MAG: hypothetical protein COU03_02205 [bacterium (Candidatus Gribaldobacteria) CG10_big_fil_rev_8_21_14_0_10_41_12]PIV47428.1 MAG: hypothetical protein COS21_00025 [bacterium (Candidatus Gribaldobacteria) CG02_land_8_20_14_3_00_41_15]PIX03472.1 MAG: hypothetical protein COZ78_00130 [bacterium (Candidatus Gribaldobacteria) CG_4_8_14_3_um_filter_42_11]PJA01454.1 MAG: hypothetical protein COX74_02665 [b
MRVWGEENNFKEFFEAYLHGSVYWRKIGRKLSERAAGRVSGSLKLFFRAPNISASPTEKIIYERYWFL